MGKDYTKKAKEYVTLTEKGQVESANKLLRSGNDVELSGLTKELFNTYFRDDLYGRFRNQKNIILSSGSVAHEEYPAPNLIKELIEFSLGRNWYGYSDSLGRRDTRESLAYLENSYNKGLKYSADNLVVSMGGTAALGSIISFLAAEDRKGEVIVAIPNYPPLVKAISNNFKVKLVPLDWEDSLSLSPLISEVRKDTRAVFLQTVINPTGKKVPESELEKLISSIPENIPIILDECHECISSVKDLPSNLRGNKNVIRIKSLSKSLSVPGLKIGWFIAGEEFNSRYYEWASTTFGGPPSIYYLMLEVLGRFEAWRNEGKETLNNESITVFNENYGFNEEVLSTMYKKFVSEVTERELVIREVLLDSCSYFKALGYKLIEPDYSINFLMEAPGFKSSYEAFLSTLKNTGVSLFPSVLSFINKGSYIRISPCVNREALLQAREKLSSYWGSNG